MKYRRFILDDGSHRTTAMHKMIAEKHEHAIDICERNILLLDAELDDKNLVIMSSMLANVNNNQVDRDFLSDKLQQIRHVIICTIHLLLFLVVPCTNPHISREHITH